MTDQKYPRLFMIGNAHLDPAWMWEWGEGMEAFIATCRSALDRMEETPGFVFTCSSAAHYRWVEIAEPELFESICTRVAEGRWEIAGGWWTQADCNLPSGEGFVRQALLGQRYFLERFGRAATVGYSPDAFGHNGGLPQLLAGAGLDAYIFCRPDPTELQLPSPLFRWFSADGSDVLAYRVPFHYNMYRTSVPKKVAGLLRAFADRKSGLTDGERTLCDVSRDWALFYGVGNHGGGPTKEQIAQIIEAKRDSGGPEIDFARLDEFLERVGKSVGGRLPEWRDDLQLNAPGCYSVHAGIKGLNRSSEHLLVRAETVAALDSVLSGEKDRYPGAELHRAWENVAFNHFHDLLCGVAIPEALRDACHLYGESLAVADRTTRYGLRRIAGRIDTRGPGQTLVVVNPHSHAVSDYVTFELWHDIDKDLWPEPVHLRVTDDDGNDLPVGTVFTSGKIGKDRIGGRFRAEVPALGWRCYRVYYGEKSPFEGTPGLISATDTALENDRLRLEFSAATGCVVSLVEKRSGVELIDGAAARPVAVGDSTDTWGHGVTRFDRIVGLFGDPVVRLVHNGPTHATVRSTTRWKGSWVEQEFTLHADSSALAVNVRIFWSEPGTMLKLAFPTRLSNARTIVEGAYASVEKSCDGTERPGGAWKAIAGDIEGEAAALGIVDTLTHGYSAEGSELRLSVLRCVGYATHDPHRVGPDEDVSYIDMGLTEFRYLLHPVVGINPRTALAGEAALLNAPLLLSLESAHDGGSQPYPRTFAGIEISEPNVRVAAFKRSEEGTGWVLRLFETGMSDTDVVVRIPMLEAEWRANLLPHEVKTFLVDGGEATETDLLERRESGRSEARA